MPGPFKFSKMRGYKIMPYIPAGDMIRCTFTLSFEVSGLANFCTKHTFVSCHNTGSSVAAAQAAASFHVS